MTLVTQFGGGKTHTLTALYHMATAGKEIGKMKGVIALLEEAGLSEAPQAKVACFVGNSWDPREGRETPWIDLAHQLAGDKGVSELGKDAKTTPPGTESLGRVFAAADAPVLVLFDEVLNFVNRHRKQADKFHAFIQNLTVAMTATTRGAAVISLPRSQVEMSDFDIEWQDKITKVVRRVAKDLIANDETEIGEVVRKRLFDDLGSEKLRNKVCRAYADWCFERRAQLPPEWTAVDSASTEAKAREQLNSRFAACYPFHPATLSVFQRKWQALSQFQQTRGTLAMLAQWISWAHRDGFSKARTEPLITLGSAPLDVSEFRSVVLGQLGESRLVAAIDADIAGVRTHARALDADTKGALRDIHRRVGTAVLFECSGGQVDKVAHLPELRFALGEPEVDTTSVDTAAMALEDRSYFLRKVGSDGFKISHTPTMKKVVSDRRASLDEDSEIQPALRALVQKEFDRGANISRVFFPVDSPSISDSPRLTLVVADPGMEWRDKGAVRDEISGWTQRRGAGARLYPGSLVWIVKKPGRNLHSKVTHWLAWKRVAAEIAQGTLGGDFDPADRAEIKAKVTDAEEAARDEVWADFIHIVFYNGDGNGGLQSINLGAGHASGSESLCGRVVTALKSSALLNESVGAGYLERNWPEALRQDGAWPLSGLRQSFLDGSLTRLVDPDTVLRSKIVEFVEKGDFGLASGMNADGTYGRLWFEDSVGADEVSFESGVFLLLKDRAKGLVTQPKSNPGPTDPPRPGPGSSGPTQPGQDAGAGDDPGPTAAKRRLRVHGEVPPELWNRLGTKLLPKLRSGQDLVVGIELSVSVDARSTDGLRSDVDQILVDLGIDSHVTVDDH